MNTASARADDQKVLDDLDDWCMHRFPVWGESFFPGALRELAEIGLQSLLLDENDEIDLARAQLAFETSARLASTLPALAIATSVARLHTYLLAKYAQPAVHEQYVSATASARMFGGFAMTEPHAGTDVRAMTTVAVDDDGEYVLSGEKSWIGLAPVSDYVIVLAKHGNADRDAPTIALVVDMTASAAVGRPGPTISGAEGMPNGTLHFNEVRVGKERRLECDGFKGMMDGLNLARIEAAAFSTGIIHRSLELSATRAENREVSGRPLSALPSIQHKLGRMWTDYTAARELTRSAAASFQAGEGGDRDLISMAKLFASDASRHHSDEAMQVFGAEGLSADGEVLRLHNASKVMQIFDGTSEIHETMLGRRAARVFGAR